MPGTDPAGMRFSWRALGVALLILALSGCGGGVAKDLLDPLEQARAALESEQMALQLLAEQRLTKSVTKTLFEDMTEELTAAEKAINSASVSGPGDEPLRDAALAAARDATSASLSGRDCLSQSLLCAEVVGRLKSSAEGVQAVLDQLEGSR
jgi:hypothetical protein